MARLSSTLRTQVRGEIEDYNGISMEAPEDRVIRFGRYVLHPTDGLARSGRPVHVTHKALSVLRLLAGRAGHTVTKEEIFDTVWSGIAVSDAALTSCIRELRRVLKDDVLRHIRRSGRPDREMPAREKEEAPPAPSAAPSDPRDRVTPMTMLRRRVAERLVNAQQTAALLTTFNEMDMSEIIRLRKQSGEAFQQRHGTKLGFMSFFVKAAIDGLKAIPQINAEIRGADIVYHKYYDVGVAVATDQGLVVPVLRDADELSFADIEKTIEDLARRARERRISVEELLIFS